MLTMYMHEVETKIKGVSEGNMSSGKGPENSSGGGAKKADKDSKPGRDYCKHDVIRIL